jgi:hypothetical protein
MDSSGNSVTACRLCQHYNPLGRMGGTCEKLDVHVKAQWDACSLAESPFETSWDATNSLNSLLNENFHEPLTLGYHVEKNELQELNFRTFTLSEC